MNTDDTINAMRRHFRTLWRAEMVIAEIKLGALVKRGSLMLVAGLVAVFGLAMLDIAAYKALIPIWGEVWALVAVAIGDFVIAGILVALANRETKQPEIALASELRDQAIAALELDARFAVDEVAGFVRRPVQFAGSVSSALVSVVTTILRARRNRCGD